MHRKFLLAEKPGKNANAGKMLTTRAPINNNIRILKIRSSPILDTIISMSSSVATGLFTGLLS